MKNILFVGWVAFLWAGAWVFATHSYASEKGSSEFKRVVIRGDAPKNGIFDASLEYADGGIGWMAYSSIQIPKFVETHLAKSSDHGKTWTFVGTPNRSEEVKHDRSGKGIDSVLRYETPSLLFDHEDKPNRRWKLFTNRYLAVAPFKETDRKLSEGEIVVQYAAAPDQVWSPPVCIVGLSEACHFHLAQSVPSLTHIKFTSEPGTIMEKGTMYMSLDAGTTKDGMGEWENYRVILLASDDHGENWRYVGTLLDHKDAMRFKYVVFTGTSLVREKGKIYLFATPSGATYKKQHGHDGTMVIEITDIEQAKIARDKTDAPQIVRRIDARKQSGGLADYDEQNTGGGIVSPQFSLWGLPEIFQIWNTGLTIQ